MQAQPESVIVTFLGYAIGLICVVLTLTPTDLLATIEANIKFTYDNEAGYGPIGV